MKYQYQLLKIYTGGDSTNIDEVNSLFAGGWEPVSVVAAPQYYLFVLLRKPV